MALAERLLNARFGDEVVDHYTYVIASDGDLMEGISHEAGSLAGHLRLHKLIVLYDDNRVSIDGPTSLALSDDQAARFAAYGWHVQSVDGLDPEAVTHAIEAARRSDRPSLIVCRTVIGYGAPTKAGTASTHGAPLGEDEVAGARERLGWPYPPFEIPPEILDAWRAVGAHGSAAGAGWDKRIAALDGATRARFLRQVGGELPDGWERKLDEFKRALVEESPTIATRVASQRVLEVLIAAAPELIGGSADLTGSNGTKAKSQQVVGAGDFSGSYIHYGVREHAMAAAMNGLALHGGLIPYGGTFLIFADYCRPAIRLSALMGLRVIYVMTHDSIGLGEDGPTHQPVEHLAALRAIPNLQVFRPGDAVETAECWALAISSPNRPSVLALTRQNVPTVRHEYGAENLCARGAYILSPADRERQVTLIASGSEVALALEAQQRLREEGIFAAVVSMPCRELFVEQPHHYQDEVLGPEVPRVAVEAAGELGWDRFIGPYGGMVGMRGFGASAPYTDLYKHFNITCEAIVETAKSLL